MKYHILKPLVLITLCIGIFPHTAGADATFGKRLADAALERTRHFVEYDSSYRSIEYPGGDVPDNLGVCADVIIRSYRALGIDLQRLVHEDMKAHFHLYPKLWGLSGPDTNIDHRRVPNLQVFFSRHGTSLPITDDPDDYHAGDLVTWNLKPDKFLPHIGIVSDKKSPLGAPLIVHNIGLGPKLQHILFTYDITGHYRYGGE